MYDVPKFDRIQYGCGMKVFDGWLNADAFKAYYAWDQVAKLVKDQIADVELTGRHPFPDNSFRVGYAEDFLEHLDQAESLLFLTEVYRTFQKGGVLRLSFPGLKGVLYRHFKVTNYDVASKGVHDAYTLWTHKHFYCYESINLVARHLGFSACVEVPYGVSSHPELHNLETRPDQADLNLVVELTK